MKMKSMKGFTLTELLIVMAIVVVLAAVAIPTFGKQLETSRETGDMEIIRNAYTEALSIATLDAADGYLNGWIGNASKAFSDIANDADKTWGAVKCENAVAANSSATNFAVYSVTLSSTNANAVTMKAKFSQAEQSGTPTSATCWKYVNPHLMGRLVPPVSVANTALYFKFEIDDNGYLQLFTEDENATESAAILTSYT